MEKSVTNNLAVNGQSQMQIDLTCLTQNGIMLENEEGNAHKTSHFGCFEMAFGKKLDGSSSFVKSETDFINGSSKNKQSLDDNLTVSVRSKIVPSVMACQGIALSPKSASISDVNSLLTDRAKNDTLLDVKCIATETSSGMACSSMTFQNSVREMKSNSESKFKDSISYRSLKTEADDTHGLINLKHDSYSVSLSEINFSDSSFLEDKVSDDQEDHKDEYDSRIDDDIMELKELSVEDDKSGTDTKKSQRTKTTDSYRPFARLLHDLGQELVRQLVYKDLIEIQVAKEAKDKLDDRDKSQLLKLTEAHSKLCSKNDVYHLPVRSCQCSFSSSSDNVMALHCEFGHSSDQFPHICCCCCDFKSKWPSQFANHMEAVHGLKARIQKKLAPYFCFFCPYEHKNWMKIELHMSKCINKFSLSSNLQPQPADCDIPVLYKPGQVQRLCSVTPPNLVNAGGRFPPPPPSIQITSPLGVSTGQSSVMEIDGQLYSLVNHNGKVLLTSLRSQIGGSSSTGTVIPPSTGTAGKVPFPSAARPPKSAVEPIKPNVPIHRETCEICGSVVNNREALWSHFRDVHRVELSRTSMREQEPWMKCTFCSTRFWTYQGLARHSSTHHNRNIAPLPQAMNPSKLARCYLCGNSQTSNPLSHFSTFHNITLLDMYQSRHCYMCNKRLKQSRAFEEHMIVQHRDIFANSEVLHTVIQALSTAYYLKTEDGILQRQPLAVQRLQHNVSSTGPVSGAKLATSQKFVSTKSVVPTTQTITGIGITSGLTTVSSMYMVSGVKIPGTNTFSGIRMFPASGISSGVKTISNVNMTSGMKGTCVAGGMKTAFDTKTVSGTAMILSEKVSYPTMRSSGSTFKTATLTMPTAEKFAQSSDNKKSKAKHESADRWKATEQSAVLINKPLKKTREEDEKDLNKLYKELSDIGRPILRSMRHKLSLKDDQCNILKRPSDSMEESLLETVMKSCNDSETDRQNTEEPVKKRLRLDLADQESHLKVEVSMVSKTDPGANQVPVVNSENVKLVHSVKNL